MFTTPVLLPQIRLPLDRVTTTLDTMDEAGKATSEEVVVCEYPGVVALARPVGLIDDASWRDRFRTPEARQSLEAVNALVFQQLIGFEGYGFQYPDGHVEAFDMENTTHRQSMPPDMRWGIYTALRGRAELSGGQEKNSDLPSGSGGTSDTAASSADAAASASATS